MLRNWGSRAEFLKVRPCETTCPEPAPPLLLDTISNAVNKAWLCTSHNNLDFPVTESSTCPSSLNFLKGRKPWRNAVFPWLVLCSAWLKWEVISMTHSEFSPNSASATFCCSVIKWRSTPSISGVYMKLGLHAGGCLALQPEKQSKLRFCNTEHPCWWVSSARLPAVSFHLTQIPTPFLKPHPDVSASV